MYGFVIALGQLVQPEASDFKVPQISEECIRDCNSVTKIMVEIHGPWFSFL